MRTFVVGDIHAHLGPLENLVAWLKKNTRSEDEVVFLGDYIDRGDKPRESLDLIIDYKRASPCLVTTLLGNHEASLLESLRNPVRHTWLLGMGGLRTLDLYSPNFARVLREEISELGPKIFEGDRKLPYDLIAKAMADEHVEFLNTLKSFHRNRHGFFAHAGVNPHHSLELQTEKDLVWGNNEFPAGYLGDELVVYGHWNDARMQPDGNLVLNRRKNTVGIDTIAQGALTCLILPSRTCCHFDTVGQVGN
jgi:serine/threonine protein phosphatase 1